MGILSNSFRVKFSFMNSLKLKNNSLMLLIDQSFKLRSTHAIWTKTPLNHMLQITWQRSSK